MFCKGCRVRTQVVDSRLSPRGRRWVRRRRHCPKCKVRFTTYETEAKPVGITAIAAHVLKVKAALLTIDGLLEASDVPEVDS